MTLITCYLVGFLIGFVFALLLKKRRKRRKKDLQDFVNKKNFELKKLHKQLNIKSEFEPLKFN